MKKQRIARVAAAMLALGLVAAACGDDEESSSTTEGTTAPQETTGGDECTELTPVTLQLQWLTQAQFGGYYAAIDQGYYEDQCLDVTILEGAVDITPQTVLANGDADFAIAWVPKALASREAGANIVDIAQGFQPVSYTHLTLPTNDLV